MNSANSNQNKTILLIDDEKSFRESIRFFLEDCDFDIYEAENGRIGTEKILSLKPDLVLIDLYMPEMTGLDVLQWAGENAPDQPIIVISGAGVIDDVAEALRRGAWDYLFKPIEDLSVLQHAVDKVLERAAFISANKNYQAELEREVLKRTNELQKANNELLTQQDKIIKSGVEEQVLSLLMRQMINADSEVELIIQSAKLLIDKLAVWHGINQAIIYQLKDDLIISNPENCVMIENLSTHSNQELCSQSFLDCLQSKIQQTGIQYLNLESCDESLSVLLPISLKGRTYAVMVLFINPNLYHRAKDDMSFMQRITDILGMGLAKVDSEREIQYLAHHDVLTGLANRNTLLDRLSNCQKLIHRHHWHGSLLFIDLDRFKNLNDSLGHVVGDELLCQVSKRLLSTVRDEDIVVRLGGDEFVILMMIQDNRLNRAVYDTQQVADKIHQNLIEPYTLKEHNYYLSCSIGICVFNHEQQEPAVDLLKHADTAMFNAKSDGGGVSRFYLPEMQQAADKRLQIEKDLRIALKESQFEMYYQPQLNIETGKIIGAEALVRWFHPDKGMISPMDFIPVAEETGMILDLGEWIFRDVIKQVMQWRDNELLKNSDMFAINICPLQFRQAEFIEMVTHVINELSADPSLFKLEITESTLIDNVDEIIDKMNQLKNLGFSFSMDDFGTGYSSLSYLKRLPLDQLKIDQSFVRDIADDENDAAIIETIIAMGKLMGLDVIAEGVETEDVLQLLKQKGCESYQGYYFSKPVSATDFEGLVIKHCHKTLTV